jgi:hypothetical protein
MANSQRGSGQGESFATFTQPGNLPRVTSIFDFSADALAQLRLWLEQNPPVVPITSIIGFTQFTAQAAQVTDSASRTSSTFGDLSSGAVGPQVTGLPDGQYLIGWAAQIAQSGGGNAQMGISVNGDDPGSVGQANYFQNGQTTASFGVKFATRTIKNGGGNTVKCLYRNTAGNTVSVQDRSLFVLKFANA